MARPLRIEYPGAFYHVMNRGHRQEPIVRDRRDKERFLSSLGRMATQYGVLIHGYCLMDNHYHLIIETPEANLSRAMQWLNVSYAAYHNRRHGCAGHLFQGRFKAILIDAGVYLESLSRYVHRNPVEAGVCSRAWDYPWSSCRYFVERSAPPAWLEVNRILGGFGRGATVARRRYADYLSQADTPDPLNDVVAGAVLGPGDFVGWVKHVFLAGRDGDAEIPELKQLRPRPQPADIVAEVARQSKTSASDIVKSGRKRNHERDMAILLARELSAWTCQDLGRYFGDVSGAAITMACHRVRRQANRDRRINRDIERVRRKLANS